MDCEENTEQLTMNNWMIIVQKKIMTKGGCNTYKNIWQSIELITKQGGYIANDENSEHAVQIRKIWSVLHRSKWWERQKQN